MKRTRIIVLGMLLVVVGAATAIFLTYRSELGDARRGLGGRSALAGLDTGLVEYADKGAGIPLLSIHGAGGGFDQGLANVRDLVGDGYRVIAPSRFGYLRTPVPQDRSPAAQADAHAALLNRVRVSRAVVVGVSAGARSAVELALRHPDKVAALVLIVPGLYSPGSPIMVESSRGSAAIFRVVNSGGDFAWWAAEKVAPSVLVRFVGVPPEVLAGAPPAEQDRVMAIVRNIEPLSLRFAGINIDSNPDLHELSLHRLRVPTLIITTRDDLFNTLPSAKYAAARIPGAKLIVYDSGGHLLVGRTAQIRTAVHAFLANAELALPGR